MADVDKKIFDVAKPGSAKPDIGSKPMIVGHKSTASDPMVKKETTKKTREDTIEEIEKKQATKKTVSKMRIEPLSKDMKSEEDAEEKKPKESKDSTDAKPEVKEDKVEEPKKEKSEESKTEKTEDKSEEKTNKKTDDKKDEKKEGKLDPTAIAMEQEDNLNKIIENKKYNVDIKEVKSGAFKTFLYVFFGLVIAGSVALFVLIDTNTINSNIDLPFRIFGSGESAERVSTDETVQEEQKIKETSESVDSTNSWFEFKNANENYSIRLADGWEASNLDEIILFVEDLSIEDGVLATVTGVEGGREGVCCFYSQFVSALSLYDMSLFRDAKEEVLMSETGKKISKYKAVITEDAEDIGIVKGSTQYVYIIYNDIGASLVMRYTLLPGETDALELIEKVVATAKLL